MMFSCSFKSDRRFLPFAVAMALSAAVHPLYSQQASGLDASVQKPSLLWTSDHAKHLIGLPEIKPKLDGSLSISATEVIFTTSAGSTAVDRSRITAVSNGDERRVKGGTVGKLGRMAVPMLIPYGGGFVVGAAMQGKVDLLTIEFRDAQGAYHGAVFILPKDEAAKASGFFPPKEERPESEAPQASCDVGNERPRIMKISAIKADGLPLLAEYKVLLYEQILRRLQAEPGFGRIVRDGDRSAAASCPSSNLLVTVNAFSKGNAALRASTGPLGTFVGATSLKYHLSLTDDQGRIIFERDLKASQRGDSESLDVADKIAKTLTKKLKKTSAHKSPA